MSAIVRALFLLLLAGLLMSCVKTEKSTTETKPGDVAGKLIGRTFIYTPNGYALRVVKVLTEDNEEPQILLETFEAKHPARRLELAVSQLHLLRDPVDPTRAKELAELIVHAAPVQGQAHLDLRLYLLGSAEQVAAGIATLMDRIAADPNDHGPASDLGFMHMKLLGELAYVANEDVITYTAKLQERRRATPTIERTLAVPVPRLAAMPNLVLGEEQFEKPGWLVVPADLVTNKTWSVGDGSTENGKPFEEYALAGGPGNWKLSIHQKEAEEIDWVVLSKDAAGEIEVRGDTPVAVISGKKIPLQYITEVNTETKLLVFYSDPSLEAGLSIAQRPQGIVFVWPFGFAVDLRGWGSCDVYGVQSGDDHQVWAIHMDW